MVEYYKSDSHESLASGLNEQNASDRMFSQDDLIQLQKLDSGLYDKVQVQLAVLKGIDLPPQPKGYIRFLECEAKLKELAAYFQTDQATWLQGLREHSNNIYVDVHGRASFPNNILANISSGDAQSWVDSALFYVEHFSACDGYRQTLNRLETTQASLVNNIRSIDTLLSSQYKSESVSDVAVSLSTHFGKLDEIYKGIFNRGDLGRYAVEKPEQARTLKDLLVQTDNVNPISTPKGYEAAQGFARFLISKEIKSLQDRWPDLKITQDDVNGFLANNAPNLLLEGMRSGIGPTPPILSDFETYIRRDRQGHAQLQALGMEEISSDVPQQPAPASHEAPQQSAPASNPETTETSSQSPDHVAELRADAREHPEKYVSGNLKDGLTFTPEKGTEAERKVRIEDVVKERDVVLTSTRYGDKEFVYDPARDSFYEALPDEQIGDQRLVILNGDIIKEKPPVPVATEATAEPAPAVEPAKTEPAPAAEPTQTEPAAAEAEVPADTTPAPEGVEASSFAPREYSKMDARSQEWVNAMFRMERTVNGIGAMRDSGDRDAYALALQKAVDAKYGFGKPVAFDLIKSPIPFAKKAGGGNFGSLAEMEFAVLDANDGHQLARVKFDAMGQGESRAQANEQALRAVFGRLHDSNDRGYETRYDA